MQDVQIKSIEQVDPEAAAALLKSVMGDHFGREKSAALWNWKHRSNPAGASLGLAAYDSEGMLIALRTFMRWRLVDDAGGEVSAVRAVDTAVHPKWRRGGLFSRLTQQSLDQLQDFGVGLVFNTPNDRSGPGYKKMGWHLLGHPNLWVKLRPGALWASGRLDDGAVLEGLRPFNQHGSQLATMTPEAAPRGGLAVLKDAAFLDWRYGQHPNLAYSIVKSPAGVALVRQDKRRGRMGVAVVDWFLYEDNLSAFGALLRSVSEQTHGDYWIMGPLTKSPLRGAVILHGFIPVPWRNVNLAARPVCMSGGAAVFQRRTAWQLNLGDLETF